MLRTTYFETQRAHPSNKLRAEVDGHQKLLTEIPISSPRVSTVDKEGETRPPSGIHDHSTSRRSARSSRRNSRRAYSRIKNDDSTDTASDESLFGEEDRQTFTISFHQRPKGPKHPGLDSLVPSDERFDRLMSYSYYLLMDTRPMFPQRSTTSRQKTLKNIEITIR